MLSLLLAAAAVQTAVDAEYAFARDAQKVGQWTAFRTYARPDAVMFGPKPVWAHEFLKDAKDPPKSVTWRPALSLVSCDSGTAVNVGPWERPKAVGYFTTVWRKEKGRWQWVYDGGDVLKTPMAAGKQPKIQRASCRGKPASAPMPDASSPAAPEAGPPGNESSGYSADRTLAWHWKSEANGARVFRTFLWNGRRYEQALYQKIEGE